MKNLQMLGYNVKILQSFSTLLYGVKMGGRVVGIPKYSLDNCLWYNKRNISFKSVYKQTRH